MLPHDLVHLETDVRQAGSWRRLLNQVDQLQVIEGPHTGVDASLQEGERVGSLHLCVRDAKLADVRRPGVVSNNACH